MMREAAMPWRMMEARTMKPLTAHSSRHVLVSKLPWLIA